MDTVSFSDGAYWRGNIVFVNDCFGGYLCGVLAAAWHCKRRLKVLLAPLCDVAYDSCGIAGSRNICGDIMVVVYSGNKYKN